MAAPAPSHKQPEQNADPLAAHFDQAFRSARLTYRGVEKEDAALITRIKLDPVANLNDNISWAHPHTQKDTDALMAMMEGNLISVIAERDGEPVGLLCLWPVFGLNSANRMAELAIDILPAHRGQGYASESLRWLMDWAFSMLGQQRVRVPVFAWNLSAMRLYERVGCERAGTERECIWRAGRWWDLHTYGMLAKDWQQIRNRAPTTGPSEVRQG